MTLGSMFSRKAELVLACLLFVVFNASASNGPPDISETSPDGKWLFHARWFSDRGYTWELLNTKTHKTYFAEEHPAENEALPARLSVLWSPDSRYLAINVYYGRIAYGIQIIALKGDVPSDKVPWPQAEEASMIKPEDRKIWKGEGIANCAASEWKPADILDIDIDMLAELGDKASHQKFRIDSSRQQTIQFTGLVGKITNDQPPDYDKVPSESD